MTLVRLFCAAALLALSAAAATARPGVAIETVNLRADATKEAPIVAKIPGGSRIEIGECVGGWCSVAWRGVTGFAVETALDGGGRYPPPRRVTRAPRPPVVYEEDDDDYYPPPRYRPVPAPYWDSYWRDWW